MSVGFFLVSCSDSRLKMECNLALNKCNIPCKHTAQSIWMHLLGVCETPKLHVRPEIQFKAA